MKKLLFTLVLIGLSEFSFSQTPEAVQLQIDDLEEAKKNLQNQIEEIDTRLVELHKTKHELSLALADHGFPGVTRQAVSLYDKALSVGRKSLAVIPKNTLLLVTELETGSYKTTYNGLIGYIPAFQFKFNDSKDKEPLEMKGKDPTELMAQQKVKTEDRNEQLIKKAREEERQLRKEESRKKREEFLIRKYSNSVARKIINKEIWIGMTKDMMLDSWGYPEDINRSVGSWGVHEQCIYGDTNVYVENGTVTSWQD